MIRTLQAPAIAGLAVELPTACRSCGSYTATIALDCRCLQCGCGARRNPLSQTTIGFLTEVARCIGRPVDPIVFRRPA
jgi:hypothetical protein